MGFARAQLIQPRSSPGVVSWLARRTGRQTSGAARWATGRRAIAGGDGATSITGGDGAPCRRIGIAGAAMHGRGRCRDGGAENDCGGQRDCCPARHFGISGLSCRGVTPNRLATAALSCLGKQMGMGTDDAKRQRPSRSPRTAAGATNRDGRARAVETNNSIVAVVTRCRNGPVSQCTRAP
jgi:hypothetical protein